MVPLVILVYLGSYWLAALCIFIGFVGVREFYNGFRNMDIHPSLPIAGVALFVLYLINGLWPGQPVLIMGWLAAVIMAGSLYMFNVGKRTPADAMATIVGIIYIEFFSYHFVLIDQSGPYQIMVWLCLLCAFGSDIFAYFTGVFLGKHKMTPHLDRKSVV